MSYQIISTTNPDQAEYIVLSSGLGGHGSFWSPQVDAFRTNFNILIYDHEGCHADTELLSQDYSMTDMAAQLLDILQKEDIRQPHVLGHALGALIGAEMATQAHHYGIQIKSLGFINAWDQLDPHTQKCFQARIELLKSSGNEAYVRAQALFLYPASYISENIEEITRQENTFLQGFPPAHNVLSRLKALQNFKIEALHTAALQQTDLYFIANRDDFLVPVRKSKDLQLKLGHGHLYEMDYGAHASTVTATDQLNQIVLKHLFKH